MNCPPCPDCAANPGVPAPTGQFICILCGCVSEVVSGERNLVEDDDLDPLTLEVVQSVRKAVNIDSPEPEAT